LAPRPTAVKPRRLRTKVAPYGRRRFDPCPLDPVALAKPWEFSRIYREADWTIEELLCEDNATYEEFESQLLEFDDDSE
jgi:hypothetical protein